MVATELSLAKCANIRANAATAGLQPYVDLREGNVFETVATLNEAFDLVFIDIWGSGYLDIFKQVERLLAPDAVILADNMYTAQDEVQPFKDYLTSHPRLVTTT